MNKKNFFIQNAIESSRVENFFLICWKTSHCINLKEIIIISFQDDFNLLVYKNSQILQSDSFYVIYFALKTTVCYSVASTMIHE